MATKTIAISKENWQCLNILKEEMAKNATGPKKHRWLHFSLNDALSVLLQEYVKNNGRV